VAVDRVAVVARLARIQDTIAARRHAVRRTAVARAVVAVVADLAPIEPAVAAGSHDTDLAVGRGALGFDALQPRRAYAAVRAGLRRLAQTASVHAEHGHGEPYPGNPGPCKGIASQRQVDTW